jgi:5-methylcytosine-specific restriction endonuclease McrA
VRFKDIDPNKEYKHNEIWDYVYERDSGYCQKCGRNQGSQQHHIIPKSKLGKTTANNLILLCQECHIGEGHCFSDEDKKNFWNNLVKNEKKFRERLI